MKRFLVVSAFLAACAPPPPCPEVPRAAAPAVSVMAAPLASAGAQAAPPHCLGVDIGGVDRAFLEKPVTLRQHVGHVSFEVTTSSKEARAFFEQGLAYLHSFVWLEAARSFHQALRLDGNLAMAYWGLSRAEQGLYERKHADEALEQAKKLVEKASPREKLYVALLAQQREAMYTLGDGVKAKHAAYKKAIENALAEYPEDPELWVIRGNAEEGDVSGRGQVGRMGSVAFYESALARDPAHAGAHHYLVHSLENSGRYADAVKHARVYAADASSVPHALHMLGHALPRAGGLPEALTQFEKAEALHEAYERDEAVRPGDDWHHAHNLELLAYLYIRTERFADAEKAFRKQNAIPFRNGLWAGLHSLLPEYLLLRGRAEEALELSRALVKQPLGTGPMMGYADMVEALVLLGRMDEAREAAAACDKIVAEAKADHGVDMKAIVANYGDYADQAHALIDLFGPKAEEAGKALLAIADIYVDVHGIDGWGSGLFQVERFLTLARKAGRTALVAALTEKLKKLDSSYVPGSSVAAVKAPAPK